MMRDELASAGPIEMAVRALVMDPVSRMPVVILHEADRGGFLPIWIGMCEANSIAMALEGTDTPRPMTHDLISALLDATGLGVQQVLIHSLDESVFQASIFLTSAGGQVIKLDSRPSDAVAIALRCKATIFVSREVLEKARVGEASEEEAIKLFLEQLDPEDMGEYEM